MAHPAGTVDQVIARVAGASHGVVTRRQLLAAGVSPDEIVHRIHRGSLLREFRGVYRVGHRARDPLATYLAAVRACGPHALLAGRAAGWLHRLLKGTAPPAEVIAMTARRLPGVTVRRGRRGAGADGCVSKAIPVTTVARTLVDLAAVLDVDDLARSCHEAGVLYATTPRQVEAVLARRPGAPGARQLRRVLHGEVRVTLSTLERRFLALLREHGLPMPETNRPAGGRRVDCRWAARALTIELDGYRFHASRHAWEQDRRREREARARGDEFRRFTYGDVFEQPEPMLDDLRGLLGRDIDPLRRSPPGARR